MWCLVQQTTGARREELKALQADLQQQLSLVRGLQHDSQQQQLLLQLYDELRTKAMLQEALYGTAGDCCTPSNKRFAAAVAAATGRWRNALVVKDTATANVRRTTPSLRCRGACSFAGLSQCRHPYTVDAHRKCTASVGKA